MAASKRDGLFSLVVVTAAGAFLAVMAWPTAGRPAWHSAVYGVPALMLLSSGIRGIVRTIAARRRGE